MNDLGAVGTLVPTLFALDLGCLDGKRRYFDAGRAAELSPRNLAFRASRSL
jgi:hypothetical protein